MQRSLRSWLVATSIALHACTGGQSGNEAAIPTPMAPSDGGVPSGGTDVREIRADSTASQAPFGLCDLVRHPMWKAGGLYEVERITVQMEPVKSEGEERLFAFAYVKLSLRRGWFNAESDAVARVQGHVLASASYFSSFQGDLGVGEVVGVLLSNGAGWNRDYFGLHNLGIFDPREGGGYSNGQLFTRTRVGADELGDMITAIAASDPSGPCPHDARPDWDFFDEDAGTGRPPDAGMRSR